MVDPSRLFTNFFELITREEQKVRLFIKDLQDFTEKPPIPDKVAVKL